MAQSEFSQLLEDGNPHVLVAAWGKLFPGMPGPETVEAAEIQMHMARTAAESVRFRYRAYSHAWLLERGLPSQLPEEMRLPAERIHPVVVEAVIVGKPKMPEWLAPVADEVHKAMIIAVEDCYANGDRDPTVVQVQMDAAAKAAQARMLGKLTGSIAA